MNPRFILHDFYYSLKQWLRSIGTVFWTILFPVLLIMIFGAIFSGADNVSYNLVVQDLDQNEFSENFVKGLEKIDIINVTKIKSDIDVKKYMHDEDKSVALVIPKGFSDSINEGFN